MLFGIRFHFCPANDSQKNAKITTFGVKNANMATPGPSRVNSQTEKFVFGKTNGSPKLHSGFSEVLASLIFNTNIH